MYRNKHLRLILIGLCLAMILAHTIAQSMDAAEIQTMLAGETPAITVGDLLHYDAFNNADNWSAEQSVAIRADVADGRYRLTFNALDSATIAHGDTPYTDTVIGVEAEQLSFYDNNAYGIVCRLNAQTYDTGYLFWVSGDGQAFIGRMDGEAQIVPLLDWHKSRLVERGTAKNTLHAVCVEDYLALYVNGEFAGSVRDAKYESGVAGFSVAVYGPGEADIAFSRFHIWAGSLAAPFPQSIANPTDWQSVITTLQAAQLIGTEGRLLYSGASANFAGNARWYTPISDSPPFADVVMGGELEFVAGNPAGQDMCALAARVIDYQGQPAQALEVGFAADGSPYIADYHLPQQPPNRTPPMPPLAGNSHHVLLVLQDDQATVYIDGLLTFENFPVEDRQGLTGLSAVGETQQTRCDGRNIWVYHAPTPHLQDCEVSAPASTAPQPVNLRSGPGTDYDSPGQLFVGENRDVAGQVTGTDGMTWWQLAIGLWVREDAVTEQGDCSGVPVIESP